MSKKNLFVLVALAVIFCAGQVFGKAGSPPDRNLLLSAYRGGESLHYTVSWMGIKAGELTIDISQPDGSDSLLIHTKASSAGLLAVFYPVEDSFETEVHGRNRLPVRHEMIQKEGSRINKKRTLYDQENFVVSYQKNEDPPKVWTMDGPAHNEFTSFLFLRVMALADDTKAMVPTFADEKRHEIPVDIEGTGPLATVFGKKETIRMRPRLSFKGLYEKVGDPLVWLTNDRFRIPVKIKASIVIGSLTATLTDYHGPKGSPVMEAPQKQ